MTKKTAISIVASFGVFALAAMAFAGMSGAHGYGMSKDMSVMDTNQDELITFEEYEASHSRDLRAVFKMLDSNGDNVIDKTEWDQFLAVHGMKKTM